MYLLYVDESGDGGDPSKNGSQYLVLGAAALFEGKWASLERDLRQLIDRYFPDGSKPTEIHLNEVRNGKNVYRRLTKPQRVDLTNDLCALVLFLLPTELTMFAVIADKNHWYGLNPGKTFGDLYAAAFEDLSSRFDLYLRRRYAEGSPCKGIIIADEQKQALAKSLRDNHRLFQRHGNRWSTLYNLIETIFFLSSHESPGLQLADLASYALWRLVTADDDAIVKRVAEIFDREPLTSARSPGKWHGIKYIGTDTVIRSRLAAVWPAPAVR